MGAAVLDGLILLVPVACSSCSLAVRLGIGGRRGAACRGLVGTVAYVAAAHAVYAPVLMARDGAHNGQTWGKQIVGIRVVRDTGEPMSFGRRSCARSWSSGSCSGRSAGFFFIPTLLDWLWPLWDDENRALHDMVVSTHVVRA